VRKLVFIFFIIASASLNAQTFQVGSYNCSVKNIGYSFPATMGKDTTYLYYLDLDGDFNNDCVIEWRWRYQSPYWNDKRGLNFIPLNSSLSFAMTGTTCYTLNQIGSWPGGTKIDNNMNWNPGGGTVFYSYWSGLTSYVCGSSPNFSIAYRKILSSDTIWGWISGNSSYNPPGNQGPYIQTVAYTLGSTSCVSVNEFKKEVSSLTIFPNPNNGEFEIKGIKEETIFILNELGQLISTKKLTRENNYSMKLSNLQSGVYFVGNKFYRQKVVVIK
jgi:hypothetical protein